MRKRQKQNALPEWAVRISGLREYLKISQGELARRMECSAMTVSRWERGLLAPSAEYYVQLGNLCEPPECWFFWERAGMRPDKITRAMADPGSAGLMTQSVTHLDRASAGAAGVRVQARGRPGIVAVPMLKGVAGTHGVSGEKWMTLSSVPATRVIGTPADWCPNPKYTSMLRVKGHSMEPLIRNNDILAVDSFQTERAQLVGKIVVAANEEKGLCVSRLRRYDNFDVLESENHQYDGIVLSKTSGWHIVAKVLWWISAAP